MAKFIAGSSTNYQTFADALHACATGSSIATLAVNAAGSGYAAGDIVNIGGGTSSITGQAEVLTVGGGGAVTAVRIYNAGLYTVNPGTGASTTAVTGTGTGLTLNTTISANGWTSQRSTNVGGAGQREVIVLGSGSGSDQIYVGWRTYTDGSSAFNMELAGFSGFNSGLIWDNQPGISPGRNTVSTVEGAYVPLATTTITWWMRITPRVILFVAKIGTYYGQGHMGFLNSFGTTTEYPYPLYIAGVTSQRYSLPSQSSEFINNGVGRPNLDSNSTTNVGPGMLYSPSGTWVPVRNGGQITQSTQGRVAPGYSGPSAFVDSGDSWILTNSVIRYGAACKRVSSDTVSIRFLPTTNSGNDLYMLVPFVIHVNNAAGVSSFIAGEIDGLFWFDTNNTIVAENRITDGNVRYRAFQNAAQSTNYGFVAMKEE